MPQGLYVFVPAFNEQKTLEKVLSDLVRLKNKGLVAGICVVNDASTDKTGKIAERFRRHGVEVIHYKRNQGKGRCFYRAVRWAHAQGAEYFGMLDADLKEASEANIKKLKAAVSKEKVDMAVGEVASGNTQDSTEISGQRIIRMSALKPLLIGNKNWVHLISGIKKERVGEKRVGGKRVIRKSKTARERVGYGLEGALNYLVGRGKAEKEVLDASNIRIAKTHFFAGDMSIHKSNRERGERQLDEVYDMGKKIERRREKAREKREERKARNLSEGTINSNKEALKWALRHKPPR